MQTFVERRSSTNEDVDDLELVRIRNGEEVDVDIPHFVDCNNHNLCEDVFLSDMESEPEKNSFYFGRVPGLPIIVENLSVQLANCSKVPCLNSKKYILKDVNFLAYPGEILLIMGESGSGKSTLLNTLACRHTLSLQYTSNIMLGSNKIVASTAHSFIRYVNVNSTFLPYLTIFETLCVMANLKLSHLSLNERTSIVQDILNDVGLSNSVNQLMGSTDSSRSSQSITARIAIATQLLEKHPILILDEPTQSLDHYLGLRIMHILKAQASRGRTIIVTLHQPSQEMFSMCDKLLLLHRGNVMFYGTKDDVIPYFSSINYDIPPRWSIPDFCISVITSSFHKMGGNRILTINNSSSVHNVNSHNSQLYTGSDFVDNSKALYESWENSLNRSELIERIYEEKNIWRNKEYINPYDSRIQVKWLQELNILLRRNLLNTFRNPIPFFILIVNFMLQSIILGLIFYNKAQISIIGDLDLYSNISILTSSKYNSSLISYTQNIDVFKEHFYRELADTKLNFREFLPDALLFQRVARTSSCMIRKYLIEKRNRVKGNRIKQYYLRDNDEIHLHKFLSLSELPLENIKSWHIRIMYLYLMRSAEIYDYFIRCPLIKTTYARMPPLGGIPVNRDHTIKTNTILDYFMWTTLTMSSIIMVENRDLNSIIDDDSSIKYLNVSVNPLSFAIFYISTELYHCYLLDRQEIISYIHKYHWSLDEFRLPIKYNDRNTLRNNFNVFSSFDRSVSSNLTLPTSILIEENLMESPLTFSDYIKHSCKEKVISTFIRENFPDSHLDSLFASVDYWLCRISYINHINIEYLSDQLQEFINTLNIFYNYFVIKYKITTFNFLISILVGLSVYPIILNFLKNRNIYNQELKNKCFRKSTFFIALNISDLLTFIPYIIVLSSVFYLMVGYDPYFPKYLMFVLICILIMFSSSGFFLIGAILSPDLYATCIITPLLLIEWIALGGFFIKDQNIWPYLGWLKNLSFFRWGYFTLNISTVSHEYFNKGIYLKFIDQMILSLNNDSTSLSKGLFYLFSLGFFYRFVAYFCFLKFNTYQGTFG